MPFKKGVSGNIKGKPKGAKGKKTVQWEALAESITGEQSKSFADYMKTLWKSKDPKDKNMAAELFIKTVEYFKPKQARVETQISGDVGIRTFKFEDADKS